MPRRPRQNLITSNSLYHIVSRGNNQKRIFRGSRDYKKFLNILEETKKKYPFYLYSYSLLPNHYHLEIETIETPVSKIMHQINNTYAKYFLRRHQGSGHLFQGRFFSALVDRDLYFWTLARYIDLNAVEAGLIKNPEDYPWGSYRTYFRKEYSKKLIDQEKFLKYWNEDLKKAEKFYLEFIKEALEDKKKRKPPFFINENMI